MAQNSKTSQLRDDLYQIGGLPSGTEFTFTISEEDLTTSAREILVSYSEKLEEMIREYANVKLEVDDVSVKIDDGTVSLYAKVGKGVIKITAGIILDVSLQNGEVIVRGRSVDMKLFKLDGEMIDDILSEPIDHAVSVLTENIIIHSLIVDDGQLVLEATRK